MNRKIKRRLGYVLGGFALVIPFVFLQAVVGVYLVPTIIVMLISQFSYIMAIHIMTEELEIENRVLKQKLENIGKKTIKEEVK